jgi:hypothetical protein
VHLTAVNVMFRKQVSDGNYGSEVAEVTMQATLDEQETIDPVAAANQLFEHAVASVLDQLARSRSGNVRRAIQVPPPAFAQVQPVPIDADPDEDPF